MARERGGFSPSADLLDVTQWRNKDATATAEVGLAVCRDLFAASITGAEDVLSMLRAVDP